MRAPGLTLLLCCVNNQIWAHLFHCLCCSHASGEGIVLKGGLVLDLGLFPVPDPAARVLIELSGSPLGYGSRCLSKREFGDLWDICILSLNSLVGLGGNRVDGLHLQVPTIQIASYRR